MLLLSFFGRIQVWNINIVVTNIFVYPDYFLMHFNFKEVTKLLYALLILYNTVGRMLQIEASFFSFVSQ